jgi:ferritin-like metal-binding protein YciE
MGGTTQHFVRRMPTAPDHLMESIKKHIPKTKREPERLSEVLKRSKGAYSIGRNKPSK